MIQVMQLIWIENFSFDVNSELELKFRFRISFSDSLASWNVSDFSGFS